MCDARPAQRECKMRLMSLSKLFEASLASSYVNQRVHLMIKEDKSIAFDIRIWWYCVQYNLFFNFILCKYF